MATTPNHGIYYPTETSQIAPLQQHFATVASSVETALNVVDTSLERIDELEDDALKRQGGLSGQNGYVINAGTRLFSLGPLKFLTLDISRAAGVNAVVAAKLPAGNYPTSTITIMGVASLGTTGSNSITMTITTTGDVRIWTASPNNTLVTAQVMWSSE